MKYIRTKDRIYNVYKETKNGYNINTKPFKTTEKTRYYLNPFISKEKVIKQSDTIEELCDLILAWQGQYWGFFMPIELEEIDKEKWDKIYGAIFTYKGLIYVAKMNEEGDLELL